MRSEVACSRSKSYRRSQRATRAIIPSPRLPSRPPAASFTHRTADTTVSPFLLFDRRDGTLASLGVALTHSKSPRFFCLDPSAKILYAANVDEGFSGQQNTDTIVPFAINQANGMLTPSGRVIKTNSPCTIAFARI